MSVLMSSVTISRAIVNHIQKFEYLSSLCICQVSWPAHCAIGVISSLFPFEKLDLQSRLE